MKNLKLFFILFLISSCGGGGGGGAPQIPFAITLASNSISIDEDTVYSGSLSATANEAVTLQYALVNSTTNGVLVFNADASIRYQPNSNYFGQDEFTYSVTAVEKNVTQTSTVNIEISAVNDAPQITMASKIDLDKNNLIFETNPIFEIYFSDVDSSDENFVFSARVNQNEVPASFTTTGDGLGNLQIDLSNLSTAGYFEVDLFV